MIVANKEQLPVDPQETTLKSGCPQCNSTELKGDTDVMDTWNTSSLTPYICAYLASGKKSDPFEPGVAREFLPMAMRPQAHDIIRTWAFYTIIKAWLHNKTIPWKSIVISGHVLSSDKDKISKSQGNNPLEPEKLLAQYPADVIRYWTASGSLGQDVAFSENQLKIGLKLQTKLWNAFRFVKDHIQNAPTEQPEKLGTLNEWVLHNASETFAAYQQQLQKNEFGHALNALERFFWKDFCDNYLELVKDCLFHPEKYSPEMVAATQWTLHSVGLQLLQMFAPYMPFITEALYGQLYKEKMGVPSLHLTLYNAATQTYPQSVIVSDLLIAIVGEVRRFKTEKQLSLKVPLESLTLHSVDQSLLKTLTPLGQLLKGVTHAQSITYTSGDIESPLLLEHEGKWFAELDLDDIIKTEKPT